MSHDRPGGRRLPLVALCVVLLTGTLVSAVVSLAFGSEPLSVSGVIDVLRSRLTGVPGADPTYDTIVWELRAPRVLMAMVVGAGLALAGACMQTLVRNPLADPYLLGVSAGAGVGATLVIVLGVFSGLGIWALSFGALAGALMATVLVFGISMAQGGITPLRLILTGVVMSAAFSSVSSFLVFFSADPKATQSVLFWLLGSLSGTVWQQILPSVIAVTIAGVILMSLHSWLDALAAGPDVAAGLGVPVKGLRVGLFVLVSVLVGVLVAVSGGIGFVGLVIPHLARILVGALHRAVLPVAALGGAFFMLWVDIAARVIVRPQEIPLSVVTGLVGAPIFLLLLGRRHYTYSGG
ncbi:FecCD family ABC transporter permease [Janibacter alittae]|uniref:Iron ABC transporter permease n=1 Tax=Janibacter alittae TaxID=3115209 RepID=A0ABZ2MIC2_9MICO